MWYRSKTAEARRKPVRIDRCHLTHPRPAKPYPLSAMRELLCAVGVVPTRVYPKSGRISALAGRQGRLRACTEDFQPEDWQRWWCLVTTFIIKSDSVPALWAGAGPLFSYEGAALWFQFCAGPGFFWRLFLCVVTKVAPIGARRLRWEVHVCLSKGQAVNRFSF